jgi:hypothetical protein
LTDRKWTTNKESLKELEYKQTHIIIGSLRVLQQQQQQQHDMALFFVFHSQLLMRMGSLDKSAPLSRDIIIKSEHALLSGNSSTVNCFFLPSISNVR